MKDSKKMNGKYSRRAQFCTFLIVLTFIGLFYQVWRVHGFDINTAIAAAEGAVPTTPGAAATSSMSATIPPISVAAAAPTSSVASKAGTWSDGEVVSALSSFYQTIITYMGLLLGLVGVLAVITLRFLSKAAAEDIAHESAKTAMLHYFETRKFAEDISNAVEEAGLAKDLERLEGEISIIKRLLQQRSAGNDDDEGTDGVVTQAPVGEH